MPIYRSRAISEIQKEKESQYQTRNPYSTQRRQKLDAKEKDKKTLTKPNTLNDEKLSRKIKIYRSGKKNFIDISAAYALGFIGSNSFMSHDYKLFELTPDNLNRILHDKKIDVEYVDLKENQNQMYNLNKTDKGKDKGGTDPGDSGSTSIQSEADYKKILKVYIKVDKMYIDHSAAFALGLTNVRDIMLEKPHLVEIHQDIIDKYKHDETIEIEYSDLEELEKEEERKEEDIKPRSEDSKQETQKYSRADLLKMMLSNLKKLETDERQVDEADNTLNNEESKTLDNKDKI